MSLTIKYNHYFYKMIKCQWGVTEIGQCWFDLLTVASYVFPQEMAVHSSILASEIPWTEEPAGLQSMGSQSWT